MCNNSTVRLEISLDISLVLEQVLGLPKKTSFSCSNKIIDERSKKTPSLLY